MQRQQKITLGEMRQSGPLMHARIGMLTALDHGKPAPTQPPRRKAVKKYRIVK
jgi:hypothetical protein